MKRAAVCILLTYLLSAVVADVYMHNPRGSNDRLNEAGNRNNANRLFDSQNNAQGGYCYGPAMSFYEGSLLSIEWTAQHACNNEKVYCNFVIQYMCSTSDADPMVRVRDGTTTDTITDDPSGPTTLDVNGELMYGMHEPYQYYQDCKTRQRNMGLWISDRESEGGLSAGRASSIFTRQNNNGNRHGYECTEERDYYPYWAASPWKDVVIMTNDDSYCKFYTSESQNVKSRWYCADANDATKVTPPNNQQDCGTKGGVWTEVPAWNIPAPECIKAPFSRDNHLGNTNNGQPSVYNWTLPRQSQEACIKDNNCNCVVRLRYNISTTDLNNLKTGNQIDGNNPEKGFIDWASNAENSPVKDDAILPYMGGLLQMALDTSQYGRTFQDRSYVFHIKSRDNTNVPQSAKVYNLNVRGKRGNIVQAYPAVEYDFVPENLRVRAGDYIHFQWTGCDTNPAGNAGEGTAQTDRSNIVQIAHIGDNVPATEAWLADNTPMFEDPVVRTRMAYLDQTGCLTQDELLAANNNDANAAKQDKRNCMKLNAAPTPYFDGGCFPMNKTNSHGYFYMSSRNNNFSNRGQKAVLYVDNLLPNWAIATVGVGAGLFAAGAGAAGMAFYAKSHPHSSIANAFSQF